MKLRKHKGSVGELFCASVVIVVLLTVVASAVNFCTLLDAKRLLESRTRQYMLYLETNGNMTNTEVTAFTNDLKSLAFVDNATVVVNEGLGKRPYGEKVSIYVTVEASAQSLHLSKVMGVFKEKYVFHIKQYSTCKALR